MNYRHAFHAGNFADVHKHVVLLALLDRLTRKPKPLFYLDTHAGRGWYDLRRQDRTEQVDYPELDAPDARKTISPKILRQKSHGLAGKRLRSPDAARGNEWRAGIARLLPAHPQSEDLRRYLTAASGRSGAATAEPDGYPGSPLLAARQLRDMDRIVLVESQLGEAQALERAAQGRRGISIVCGDGYAALKTYLPPKENRGLVLIDPPYESGSEFADAERGLRLGLGRWPNGVFALWYPIKVGREVQRLHASLRDSGLRKLLILELSIRPADSPLGLNGSGLLIANPPWQFDIEMRATLEELHALLASDRAGGLRLEWLAGE